jgi:hypothetical protein
MRQTRYIVLSLIMSIVYVEASAQEHYAMYGVFFYNFTKYIQWPDDYNQGDFEILVLGETPMTAELKKLAERKKINGRSFKIIEITSVNEIKKCQAIFLAASSPQLLPSVAKKIKGLPVLLVTEMDGATKKGAAINHLEKEGKPAFEINLETTSAHKLKVFSELVKWAVVD